MKVDSIERQSLRVNDRKGTMMVFNFFSKIKYWCLIGLLGCIVLFMTGCGTADEAIVLIPPGESVAEFPELEAAEQAAETRVVEPQTVYVYVCGAVRAPGVVEVPEGSRAAEALELAGGMTTEADPLCQSGGNRDRWTEIVFSHSIGGGRTGSCGEGGRRGTREHQHGIRRGIVYASGNRSIQQRILCATGRKTVLFRRRRTL